MRVVVLGDIHFPYQSAAWDMAVDLIPRIKPDKIILIGDVVDFYSISRFTVDPKRALALQSDLNVAVRELKRLRAAAPDAEIIFKEGNHELRLQTYLFTKASALSKLDSLSLPELLKFGEWGVSRFLQNNDKFKIDHLYFVHGNEVMTGTVHPARSLYLKLGVNVICGHVHKFDRHSEHSLAGKERGAWTNGCLCELTPDYAYNPQWDNGFIIVDFVEKGLFNVQQIKFFRHNGVLNVIYDGELISKRGKKCISLPPPLQVP